MKTLIKTLALSLMAVSAATPALARSPMLSELSKAELTVLNVDPNLNLNSGMEKIAGGSVTINHTAKQVTLVLRKKLDCALDRPCPRYMPAPVIIQLPLIRQLDLRDGSKRYEALVDHRPVDGALQRIVIRDLRGSIFAGRVENLTQVTYDTEVLGRGIGEKSTHSTFEGEGLVESRGF